LKKRGAVSIARRDNAYKHVAIGMPPITAAILSLANLVEAFYGVGVR
jgi:hypothetical protein